MMCQQAQNNDLGAVKSLILKGLEQLREAVGDYFTCLSIESFDWIILPFDLADIAEELDFTLQNMDLLICLLI